MITVKIIDRAHKNDINIKNGFLIGGMDTEIYTGTSQEGKKDILFYLDMKK